MMTNCANSESKGSVQTEPEDRVASAESEKLPFLKTLLAKHECTPGDHIFLRAFKHEKELEVWIKPASNNEYVLLRTYPICATSGRPGPKLKQGDLQVPEGFYHISVFNTKSKFHLSLGINYPNQSDRHFCDKDKPGGDIFIHGNCVSAGCLAMTNDYIREIFVLCNEAKNNGQEQIPIHILPFRFSSAAEAEIVKYYPEYKKRWDNLRQIDQIFEKTRVPAVWNVDDDGNYFLVTN